MLKQLENLIIIPARKGSKRVPNKNIRLINGKPLVYYTLKYALKNSSSKNYILTSTDCPVTKSLSKKLKIDVMDRPVHLATDTVSLYYVLVDIIIKLKSYNMNFDYLTLLQPTSPIRSKNLINKGIKILKKDKKLTSIIEIGYYKYYTGTVTKNNVWTADFPDVRSQELPKIFLPTGGMYIYRISKTFDQMVFEGNKVYALIEKNANFPWVNIDYELDFSLLKVLIKKNKKLLNY